MKETMPAILGEERIKIRGAWTWWRFSVCFCRLVYEKVFEVFCWTLELAFFPLLFATVFTVVMGADEAVKDTSLVPIGLFALPQ